MVNPNKADFIRDLGKVNVKALKAAVLSLSESVWGIDNHTKPNKFEVLQNTQHIVFKFVSDLQDVTTSYARKMWPLMKLHIEPVITQAVGSYEYADGDFPRIMLAKLPPGGRITPHFDGKVAYPHKIHIPLQTNDATFFYIEDKEYHFAEGFAYEVNNLRKHAAVNNGSTDRIHLIFEYYDKRAYLQAR